MSHIFISHGTMWQAYHGDPAWSALTSWMAVQPQPAAIIVISGHWAEDVISVTADSKLPYMNEGFPPPMDRIRHQPPGAPDLARQIVDVLGRTGVAVQTVKGRGLDHGAVIPLRAIDPTTEIPTVQLSLHHNLDPAFHVSVGTTLQALPKDVLIVCSGGLVHNRQRIVPMSGRDIPPEVWAKEFDQAARGIVLGSTGETRNAKLMTLADDPSFPVAHPTPEHFTPLFVASGLGGTATEIASGFQWQNLSMTSFGFSTL